jgi:flagellar biosynthesis GTPase FlhF
MIIKSFTADTSAAVLKDVRSQMGGAAIVLNTRQSKGADGKPIVEVTACVENPTVAQSDELLRPRVSKSALADTGISPRQNSALSQDDLAEALLSNRSGVAKEATSTSMHDTALEAAYDALIDADIPRKAADDLIAALSPEAATDDAPTALHKILVDRLCQIMTPEISFKYGDRVLFIGSAGVGKSSVMGKLAARLVAQETKKVRLATLDDCKIGAAKEFGSYVDCLGVEEVQSGTEDFSNQFGADEIALIDSPGLSTDDKQTEKLIRKIEGLETTHRIAVFSALTRTSDAVEQAFRLKPLAPTHFVVTMLDLTDRLGSVMSVAESLGVKMILATDGPGGIGELRTPDPNALARRILKLGAERE